ncbi:hypothetical protein KR49_09790 [Synechococcus sp. KORDI-49]|uniref:ChbG/HpnK family deacetylase n=1 Tax=Synechococcus sp. KORDI-49 TaxID=585423 RepID=UPI0004E049C0|nr:ChbG/HpnK family deacetylase [Synechococcus sp. KORDI-49]AII46731.1 hypothetical protein KR49_09790 [Synechococcus sp. KORDI-49]
MKSAALLRRLGRYGAVGAVAAGVHLVVLISLEMVIPSWLANPLAFLAASVAGYLGHALVTFREETGGRRFARRWLILQYGINLSVCALLPLLLTDWAHPAWRTLLLVFTPTVLNALIWSRAARFSQRQRHTPALPDLIHADDLGLAPEVDEAILSLATSGQLQGASLLVDGASAQEAAAAWRTLPDAAGLCLHLCLTEGPGVEGCPDLPASFGTLLLASLLPARRQRFLPQLERAIEHQVHRFRTLTEQRRIPLDGHQHIHLTPIVLDCLLRQSKQHQIDWIRTTREPLPTDLPLSCWWSALRSGGLLKWLVLQLLSGLAIPRLKRAGISTNGAFSGVLFTGRMTGRPLEACLQGLAWSPTREGDTPNLLLSHPAVAGNAAAMERYGFQLSAGFFSSTDRQREWQALRTRAPRG